MVSVARPTTEPTAAPVISPMVGGADGALGEAFVVGEGFEDGVISVAEAIVGIGKVDPAEDSGA